MLEYSDFDLMKKYLHFSILLLSIVIGWFLGYINFPFINQSNSFWVGLVGGLSAVLLVRLLTNRGKSLESGKISFTKGRFLFPVVTGALVISVLFLLVQNKGLRSQVNTLNQQSTEVNSISSSQQIEFLEIMNSLLDTVAYELRNSKSNTLSTSTVGRIVAFSQFIGSHQFIATDTGVYKKTSPVKGHLLLSLIHMKMDSSSFNEIKRKVSFEGADLRNANLSGYNLGGINLKEANLEGASLIGTNLSNANLYGANFHKADMENIDLSNSVLKKAQLRWSNLGSSNLYQANLEKVDLRNANLYKADLRNAIVNETMLTFAILRDADLSGCELNQVALRAVDLSNAKLVDVSILYSTFINTNLSYAKVDSGWLSNLKSWKISGEDELINNYKMSYDTEAALWELLVKD